MTTPRTKRPAARPAKHLLLVGAILLLATALRFYRLDGQSLWADEGNSAALALRTLVQITRDAGRDIHPPLYYWLLHFWVLAAGSSEVGLRSFSACTGILVVALTYALGTRIRGRSVGSAAAFVAALSPFQTYYSQEARMYILLTLLSATSVYSLLRYLGSRRTIWLLGLVLSSAAGLYTHYSFVFMWPIANGLWLAWTVLRRARGHFPRWIGMWALGQMAIVGLYVPWLPIAYRQVGAWPAISQPYSLRFYLHQAFRLWSIGETAPVGTAGFLLLWGMIILWLLGAWPAFPPGEQRRSTWLRHALALSYCLLPVLLQWGLALLRPAYRPKFFLAATPAFAVVVGQGIVSGLHSAWPALQRTVAVLSLSLVLAASASSLSHYYFVPAWSRDDYRSVAAYITAVERDGDAILLNAPGQWEVFRYYYGGDTPVYGLPGQRPPNQEETQEELERIGARHRRLFCLFWATEESDPDRMVEGWLDQHAYKALDLWQGNVRFVTYALPRTAPSGGISRRLTLRLGDRILLKGYTLQEANIAAGEILQLAIFWQAEAPIQERYKVFVQVLDASNNIVGQRDTEPGGGARLTTLWAVGETVVDNYGVLIRPGTPPGRYRLITGLYNATTGARLWAEGDDKVLLTQIDIAQPAAPLPLEAYGMQYSRPIPYDPLTLLGYDVFKLGFDWRPEEPLHPGDILHLNLYWQANDTSRTQWRLNLRLVDEGDRTWWRGEQIPLSGQPYPTTEWQRREIVRGQYNLSIPAHAPPGRYRLEGEVLPLGGGQSLQPLWRSHWLRVGS